jgi:hypothetical protein
MAEVFFILLRKARKRKGLIRLYVCVYVFFFLFLSSWEMVCTRVQKRWEKTGKEGGVLCMYSLSIVLGDLTSLENPFCPTLFHLRFLPLRSIRIHHVIPYVYYV